MLNLIFADILSFMNSGFLQELVTTGTAGGTEITPAFLLIAAIVTEIPIMMILLSHVLKYQINHWVNIIAAVIASAYVIRRGSSAPHYVFIAAVETACLLFIIGYAWRRRDPTNQLA